MITAAIRQSYLDFSQEVETSLGFKCVHLMSEKPRAWITIGYEGLHLLVSIQNYLTLFSLEGDTHSQTNELEISKLIDPFTTEAGGSWRKTPIESYATIQEYTESDQCINLAMLEDFYEEKLSTLFLVNLDQKTFLEDYSWIS